MRTLDYVYEVYKTNAANGGMDVLNIGLPMFQADVLAGEQKNCPVALDFAALKADYLSMTTDERAADNKEFREFVGRHVTELAEAYKVGKEAMLAVVNGTAKEGVED